MPLLKELLLFQTIYLTSGDKLAATGLSRLRGGRYAYPSGQRAIRVLPKLVQYSEYLRREGIHREQIFAD